MVSMQRCIDEHVDTMRRRLCIYDLKTRNCFT
jgi:hypothetical protein